MIVTPTSGSSNSTMSHVPCKVVVSAGTKNFHMLMSAEEVSNRHRLAVVMCGAYPIRLLSRALRFAGGAKFRRFLARRVNVPNELVRPLWIAEVLQAVAFVVRRLRRQPTRSSSFDSLTLKVYHKLASRVLKKFGQARGIYHFRAAFGGESVKTAKELGMVTICDHSLADPRLLPALVQGHSNPRPTALGALDTVSQAMCGDILAADWILVNSEFVKETLVACGVETDRIRVNYLGVDEAFVRLIPEDSEDCESESGPIHLLFAGFFGLRKGADVLLEALRHLQHVDWRLTIAGGVDPCIDEAYRELLVDPRIHCAGPVSRPRLAELMSCSDLFVLPSRAEGSARVLFEAMACGCPVLTTREAGSIVVDGRHGYIVERDNVDAVSNALTKAFHNRAGLEAMGLESRREVMKNYRQYQYGERLMAFYEEVADEASRLPAPGPP